MIDMIAADCALLLEACKAFPEDALVLLASMTLIVVFGPVIVMAAVEGGMKV